MSDSTDFYQSQISENLEIEGILTPQWLANSLNISIVEALKQIELFIEKNNKDNSLNINYIVSAILNNSKGLKFFISNENNLNEKSIKKILFKNIYSISKKLDNQVNNDEEKQNDEELKTKNQLNLLLYNQAKKLLEETSALQDSFLTNYSGEVKLDNLTINPTFVRQVVSSTSSSTTTTTNSSSSTTSSSSSKTSSSSISTPASSTKSLSKPSNFFKKDLSTPSVSSSPLSKSVKKNDEEDEWDDDSVVNKVKKEETSSTTESIDIKPEDDALIPKKRNIGETIGKIQNFIEDNEQQKKIHGDAPAKKMKKVLVEKTFADSTGSMVTEMVAEEVTDDEETTSTTSSNKPKPAPKTAPAKAPTKPTSSTPSIAAAFKNAAAKSQPTVQKSMSFFFNKKNVEK